MRNLDSSVFLKKENNFSAITGYIWFDTVEPWLPLPFISAGSTSLVVF